MKESRDHKMVEGDKTAKKGDWRENFGMEMVDHRIEREDHRMEDGKRLRDKRGQRKPQDEKIKQRRF